jgi:hypothetical protein
LVQEGTWPTIAFGWMLQQRLIWLSEPHLGVRVVRVGRAPRHGGKDGPGRHCSHPRTCCRPHRWTARPVEKHQQQTRDQMFEPESGVVEMGVVLRGVEAQAAQSKVEVARTAKPRWKQPVPAGTRSMNTLSSMILKSTLPVYADTMTQDEHARRASREWGTRVRAWQRSRARKHEPHAVRDSTNPEILTPGGVLRKPR